MRFFSVPPLPNKDLSSEPFAAVCQTDSVGSAHNCSVRTILCGRPTGHWCPNAKIQLKEGNLVVEDDTEEGAVVFTDGTTIQNMPA